MRVVEVGVEGEGEEEDEVSDLEEVVRPQPDHNLHLLVGSFSRYSIYTWPRVSTV